MDRVLRRVIAILLVFVLGLSPCLAAENPKVIANVSQDFGIAQGMPSIIKLTAIKKTIIDNDIVIPQRAIVSLEVLQTQNERRWHKSGFIVCKLKSFEDVDTDKITDISDKDIYFVVRKYEPLDKKDASITATEIVLTQAASLFAPGVDILYYFTKGAIQREKHPNWFKAGVRNAYDNSIFWFWLKGKPIDLKANEQVAVQNINESRANILKGQIEIRKDKKNCKDKKEEANIDYLEQKIDAKKEYKAQKKLLSENKENAAKSEINAEKKQLKSEYRTKNKKLREDKNTKIKDIKASHKAHKQQFKVLKQEIKIKNKQLKKEAKEKKEEKI